MRIYILPYGNKAYFSYNKRVSGVDTAQLMQYNMLKELGHDVRMWAGFTDLQNYIDDVDFYKEEVPDGLTVKEYEKTKRQHIEETMFRSLLAFKPDVILSNWIFNNKLYQKLMNFDIPIVYNSHSIPGFWSDLMSANMVAEFTQRGHTLLCVSDYHASRTVDYYNQRRSAWTFDETPVPDNFLFSSAVPRFRAVEHDGVVRHVSAASQEKSTFGIHKLLDGSDIVSEVYTTLNYVSDYSKNEIYVKKNLELYNEYPRVNKFDVDHSEIMDNIAKSVCTFVGLHPVDSFTITSLESLSRGVPIIVKGFKGRHPAQEMVEDHMKQYIYVYDKKEDVIAKVKEWSNMTIGTRQAIADSCYIKCSQEAYKTRINEVLDRAISKYENNAETTLHLDQFMI